MERAAGADPAALMLARTITAAAVAGHEETIAAAAGGDMVGAQKAAGEWQQEQERRLRMAQRDPADTATLAGPSAP